MKLEEIFRPLLKLFAPLSVFILINNCMLPLMGKESESPPQSVEQIMAKVDELIIDAEYRDCISLLSSILENKAIDDKKTIAEVRLRRSEIYRLLNDDPKALSDLDQAIVLCPKMFKAYFDRAMILSGRENYAKAIDDYSKAILYAPDPSEYLGYRAMLYKKTGKTAEAISDFDRVLKNTPGARWALVQRGILLQDSGRLKDAQADFDQLIKTKPGDFNAYELRGKCFMAEGKLEKAIEDFSEVVELSPDYMGGYANRAKAYTRLNGKNCKKAADDLAMAKKLGYVE